MTEKRIGLLMCDTPWQNGKMSEMQEVLVERI